MPPMKTNFSSLDSSILEILTDRPLRLGEVLQWLLSAMKHCVSIDVALVYRQVKVQTSQSMNGCRQCAGAAGLPTIQQLGAGTVSLKTRVFLLPIQRTFPSEAQHDSR